MGGLRETVVAVYDAGAELRVEDGKLGVKNPGLIDSETLDTIKAHKGELIEMLTGDPLHGPGWEGRTALWLQAMRWLDQLIADMGLEGTEAEGRAHQAIAGPEAFERLNVAWIDGTFEEFRQTLKEYVGAGLRVLTKGRSGEWR